MKIKLCPNNQINNNESYKFIIPTKKFDRDGVLIRFNDKLYAYYNECPHIGIALDWDDNDFFTTDKMKLHCKNHGAEFLPEDGNCVSGPCVDIPLKTIQTTIEDDTIYAIVEDQ